MLAEDELRAARRSDTVFVFGSGKSLLEIPGEEWERIGRHDTIGFSQFCRQRWVRVDYHVVAEVNNPEEYAAAVSDNPCYRRTIFVVQEGWMAEDANDLLGRGLLPAGSPVFRYRRTSRANYSPPSDSFRCGLVHCWNSSTSVTNFALLLGWRRIVLAGVDLYDREYFWLPPGQAHPDEEVFLNVRSRFSNADRTVDLFALWRELLEPRGVEVLVYKPRSLLAGALDVCWQEA